MNCAKVNARGQLIRGLLKENNCLDQILELIDDEISVFRQALFYTAQTDRFDVFRELLKLNFKIDTQTLQHILSSDPQYFNLCREYYHDDVMKPLIDQLNDLANTIDEEGTKNIIQNMKNIDLESSKFHKILFSLIKIDRHLTYEKLDCSIEDDIIYFLDQYEYKLDSRFTPLLATSKSTLIATLLEGHYYEYDPDIFIMAIRDYNYDLTEYLIKNYPIKEIDISLIFEIRYGFYNLEDFERYYSMLKLLTDHGIETNCTKLSETTLKCFIKMAKYLRDY